MTEFNLLPDIKLAYIKAERQKQLIVSISVIASIAAVVVLALLLLFVDVVQKGSLSSVSIDIKHYSSQLQGTKDLNKILTVQNQLAALPALEKQNPLTSRIFGYLTQVTPAQVGIANLAADFTQNTMTITGTADSLATVNTYVDTLKFTTYKTDSATTNSLAFSNVVLSTFSRDSKSATYTIACSFDPAIFSQASNNVSLTVPKIISTRSEMDRPTDLFVAPPTGSTPR
jgi:Tfp pilus assembly protein PilN